MADVRVGTGILVIKDKQVLVGKRKGSHAAGLISFPGGHLDYGETWESCVLRELEEECGPQFKVKVRNFSAKRPEFFVTNDIMHQYNKHYITIFMVADWVQGEPINMEPNKCDGWEWFNYDQLRTIAGDGECADWIPMNLIDKYSDQIGL